MKIFKLPLRHAGQYKDDETELFYNYYRFYDPKTGRYITSDPIGLDGGMNTYGYVEANPLSSIDRLGLCWSNPRAINHYYTGGGKTVTLDEIGCTSQITSKIQNSRNIWINKVHQQAVSTAKSMPCNRNKKISLNNISGVSSGIFWIGGFALFQDANCSITTKCSDNDTQCIPHPMYTYNCSLTYRMNDAFTNPSDFDNSAGTENADFWDEWSYFGKDFNVVGNWSDSISGSGKL